jgi:hypothetical protein
MSTHEIVRVHEAAIRSEDSLGRILAVWTVALCVLGFALAVAAHRDAGVSLADRDSAQVLNYVAP